MNAFAYARHRLTVAQRRFQHARGDLEDALAYCDRNAVAFSNFENVVTYAQRCSREASAIRELEAVLEELTKEADA